MTRSYQFTDNGNKFVARSDGTSLPWDSDTGGPKGGGEVWAQWVKDGSPNPDAFVAPPATLKPLERWRFMAMLEKSGLENQIRAYIGTLSGDARLAAKHRFQSADRYHIDDPLIKSVQAALKIPNETLQGLWRQAESL